MCVISSCLSKTYTVSRFSYISMKIGVGRSYDGWLKIKQDWKDPFLLPLDLLRVFPAYQPQPKVRERVQKLISVILSVQASGIESRAWKMQSGSGGANRRNLVQTMRQMEKFSERETNEKIPSEGSTVLPNSLSGWPIFNWKCPHLLRGHLLFSFPVSIVLFSSSNTCCPPTPPRGFILPLLSVCMVGMGFCPAGLCVSQAWISQHAPSCCVWWLVQYWAQGSVRTWQPQWVFS